MKRRHDDWMPSPLFRAFVYICAWCAVAVLVTWLSP
jgi:hypothetical protein